MRPLVVVGTDTGVGKTVISCGLLKYWQQQGYQAQGIKPIASGCELMQDGWRNEDALLLQKASSQQWSYEQVNPFAFPSAIAPHLAAEEVGMSVSVQQLKQYFDSLQQNFKPENPAYSRWLIEGAGGWYVPINQQESLADWLAMQSWPVVLVVGLRLGCLNHSLLTQQAILRSGAKLVGWVANQCQPEPMAKQQQNIEYLNQHLQAPCWGVIPFLSDRQASHFFYSSVVDLYIS